MLSRIGQQLPNITAPLFKGCVTDYRQFAVASNSAWDATQMVSIHTNPEASGPCAPGGNGQT